MHTLLIVIVVILLVGGWPSLGFHNRGYAPSGVFGLILIILLILILAGRL